MIVLRVKPAGLEEMKQRLLAMSAVGNQRVLQPIIDRRVKVIRDMMSAKAPIGKAPKDPHPGRLRGGVVVVFLRGGIGYCKYAITLTKIAYYGLFQELGLGGKISAKTQKRYDQYAFSKGVQKGLKQRGYSPAQIIAAKLNRTVIPGLSKGELRRQAILARGRRLQGGGRRRNMAAQPFFRPVLQIMKQWFVQGVAADVWAAIAALGAPGAPGTPARLR